MPAAYRADSAHVVGNFYFVRKDKMQLDEPEPCATFERTRLGAFLFAFGLAKANRFPRLPKTL